MVDFEVQIFAPSRSRFGEFPATTQLACLLTNAHVCWRDGKFVPNFLIKFICQNAKATQDEEKAEIRLQPQPQTHEEDHREAHEQKCQSHVVRNTIQDLLFPLVDLWSGFFSLQLCSGNCNILIWPKRYLLYMRLLTLLILLINKWTLQVVSNAQ